jgi:pimeloyl-ACP methyl ester carboxylesterase
MVKEFEEAKADSAMFWPIRRLYEQRSPTPEKWPEFFEQERAMALSGPNWSLEQLATIRSPVLFINGEHDIPLLPYATEMQKAIPGAQLQIVAGSDHMVPLAKPEIVNPMMLSFLKI